MVTNMLIASAMLLSNDPTCPIFNPIDEPIGQLEESAKALAKTISKDSSKEEKITLIKQYMALGEYEDGLDLLTPILADTPTDRELQRFRNGLSLQRINNAGFLSQLGAAKKMRAGCEDDLAVESDNTNAMLCLARFFGNAPGVAGGSKNKRDQFLETLKANDEAKYHFGRVTAGVELTPDEQIAALQKSLELEENADVRLQLAFAHIQRQEWAQAFEAFDAIVQSEGDKPLGRVALYQKGRVSAMSGENLEGGIRALRTYLSGHTWVAGQNFRSNSHGLIGVIYEKQGCLDEALAAQERAISLNKRNKAAKKRIKDLKREIKKRKT